MPSRAPFLALLVALSLSFATSCSNKDDAPSATPSESGDASAAPTMTATTAPGGGPGKPQAGSAQFEGSNAMAHIKELSQTIGARVAGTPGEEEAVRYIANEFRVAGYTVDVREFSYEGDRFRAGTVKTGTQSFDSFTMTGSDSGSVTAPMVYVGEANLQDVEGKDLAGRVAVADRGGIPFGEKAANVRGHGAVALIVANNEQGDFIGNAGDDARIPVVGVDDEAGSVLRTQAQAGQQVTIEATGERSTSKNVLARAGNGRCKVLVGAHHDTVPAAPGALDNASGAATAIDLARAFAADGLDDGLCFATFGAEESGLFGSGAMAEQMAKDGDLPRFMMNLDMTGLGDSVDLIGSPDLVRKADSIAEKLQIAAEPTELGSQFGSDHQSFQQQGVPVVFLTTNDLGKFHTPEDTLATIDPADLENAGDLAYALITELLAQVARG